MQIDLVLENRSSHALAEGIDILVRSGLRMPEEPYLVVRDIGPLELGIYAGSRVAKAISRKASPQEVALLPWIGHRGFAFDQGLLLRQGDNEVLLRVQPWLWSSDILAISRMTEQGDSCAILPHWLARPGVAQGTLQAVLSDWRLPAAQIWLAWRNRGSNRESVAHVAHHLREQLPAGFRTRTSAFAGRTLQTFRHLHACSGCFRLERLPGGACTRWKAPPLHGAHPQETYAVLIGLSQS